MRPGSIYTSGAFSSGVWIERTKAIMTETRKSLEHRRIVAAQSLKPGDSQADVARAFGVSRTTTHRWAKMLRNGKSLTAQKPTGRPPKLRGHLIGLMLSRAPQLFGQTRWTGKALAVAVEKEHGVKYNSDHCSRLMAKLGYRAMKKGLAA